ncbi:hypothetical protein [Paenibacillus sp. 32O-W]|uniref:hypothetical protein n=1 Tax=Paenibacillus sp. 32O-W TaxID=1695218 RepID=UPI00078122C6|nr:hypothetical protein [Paenibacillus sp. 32O-W]
MLAFHLWFVPLFGAVLFYVLRKKQIRDAFVFVAVSLMGYGLWLCIVNQRPFIISLFIASIINAVKRIF